MIQFFAKKMRNRKGFTLVELLIVIAVLGILAGIAIPRLSGVTESAKKRADEVSANAILKDVQAGLLIGSIVPAANANWQNCTQSDTSYLGVLDNAQSTGSPFIVQVKREDATSNTIDIRVGTTSTTFEAEGSGEYIPGASTDVTTTAVSSN